nr:hypothetical protein L203_05735 [Cryptococcus depauperatus CBS 7841]
MSLLPFSKSLEHKKTKHWTLGIASKHRLSWSRRIINQSAENEGSIRNQAKNDRETGPPYGEQEIKRPYDQCATINTTRNFQEHKQWDQSGNNDWEVYCEDMESDVYSWVATEMAGTEAVIPTHCINGTKLSRPLNITLSPGALTSSSLDEITSDSHQTVDAFTQVSITPEESFALLLDYQSSSDTFLNDSVHPHAQGTHPATFPIYAHMHNANPEWHDLVDRAFCNSLTKQEQRRQGLWWELIKGEREYVRDMGIVCNVFMQSLRDCRTPVIEPARLELFSVEVFSNAAQIYHVHIKILKRLMERQRQEWPLLATATDIFLQSLLEIADLYDAYMKNYPFAQASVRRELATNDAFQQFINSCTTASLTYKRDIFVFLSRPVTRFPRMLLILDALLRATPVDHSDCEDIPILKELLERVVKSSQPGIESAEGKIKLWNTAERLLFRKGEIVVSIFAVAEDSGWMLVISSGILYAFGLQELIPTSEPSTWNVKSQRQGEILSRQGQTVIWVCTGKTKGKTLGEFIVAYATYSKSSHVTQLEFLEPLPGNTFRLFAQSLSTLNLPGYASCLTFFRQTVAVITEKSIIIVEPGSSTYHCVPAPGSANSLGEDAPVLKLLSSVGRKKSGTKPLGMWQIGGNEFVLVYDWGACFVTKYGELCRLGAFLKWNIVPSYAFYSPPYLLLFDEHYYRVEVRVAITGKMCEVVEEKGLRMIPWSREGQAMIGWSQRGLIRLVETEAIQS